MKLNLSGIWEVAFEEDGNRGEYKENICLPATTEQAELGELDLKETSLYLGRKRPICKKVWYQRKIEIPNDWSQRKICLFLERTKFTKVWIDNKLVGESYETLIPQRFEIDKLSVGEHTVTISVDNDLEKYDCFPNSLYQGHQYTEHTQTNWNGILGEMYLTSYEEIYVKRVLAYRHEKELEVKIELSSQIEKDIQKATCKVDIRQKKSNQLCYTYHQELNKDKICFSISNDLFKQWDEFDQTLYEIVISILDKDNKRLCEDKVVTTGIRYVEVKGNELRINDKRVSLRGSLDCAIYPRTGACPFDVESWLKILGKIKAFGMNHYRFHSWCPPKAAFVAADYLGIYLQVELSCFANELYQKTDAKYDQVLEDYLYNQATKVLEEFGNHPSFVLFAVGNEMKGNSKAYQELLKTLKKVRKDILYSQGANNFLEDPICCEEDQFWVTMRTKPQKNIRASFSHNDLPLGSIQEKEIRGTLADYHIEAKESSIPLIAHEIGQYQSFPNIEDKEKYTGVLRGDVYTILEKKLKEKGLLEKNKAFYEASGKLLVQCYKAEIEANLRTANMSGFQLLGLQDFTGQGTALIGVLDSFLENKGFIEETDFRKFCNEVVVMATLPKYCYSTLEEVPIEVYIYNYSNSDKLESLSLELKIEEEVVESVICDQVSSQKQGVEKVWEGILKTSKFKRACSIMLSIKYGAYENEYPLWIYPEKEEGLQAIQIHPQKDKKEKNEITYKVIDEKEKSVWVTNHYDESAKDILKQGGNVLLCTSNHAKKIEGFFPTDFWCYPMFQEACIQSGNPVAPGTMGLLIQEKHAAMELFPTNSYAQWQWQQIVSHGAGVILDQNKEVTILVQVIDNFDRNHVLGLIYEEKVGKGNLLVCASDLLENLHIPEMKQLYASLLHYSLQ